MATYVMPAAQAPIQRTPLSAGQPITSRGRLTLAANLAVGDVVQLFRVPQGAVIRNALIVAQKVDSGGAPAFAFTVGDAAGATHLFGAQTVAQAGGNAELAIGAAVKGYQYPNDDIVYLTVTAAAQTQVGGATIDVYLDTYQG